ncbi:tripartite-type tricarboxylate transporter receptor subunit TctC [Variovorax boronicumulans]|uniref:Bug family tripartite tricarboxylate transporter substrate binding protein n=1 Tax=Variovorax boronicumulans TaxID=436515 RepID=UPI0024761750|nr:tripartite tricarboxylate transporter substrate binding protein [Variovorax boronicumulans]MDH6164959.1 tripartite-type tricarboxylate transporter receptor subunit TctC [Variovorax boronicumulans]
MIARRKLLFATGGVAAWHVLPSFAQDGYPNRAVRLVVGYPAGGTTDMVGRLTAKELSARLGQPFVVENRPGASSNIATASVARAAPDGYTLLLATASNATNVTAYRNLSFDIQKDFVPVAAISIVPNVLVVSTSSQFKTFDDYLNYARKNPGNLTFASASSGSSTHLAGELFKTMAKVDMLHVPYAGSAPAITDVMGGQVDSIFDNLPSALPHIAGGKLRALAVTSPTRAPALPGIPTVAELGFPGFEAYSWQGLMAPKGTPDAVVQRLSLTVFEMSADPSVIAQIVRLGGVSNKLNADDFRRFVKAEIDKWAPILKQSGAIIE